MHLRDCPMALSEIELKVDDTTGGVALEFETPASHVEELQRRVRQTADMLQMHQGRSSYPKADGRQARASGARRVHGQHEPQGRRADGNDHPMMGAPMGQGLMQLPKLASVRIENTTRGARLLLTPKDEAELSDLRQRVRQTAGPLERGGCLMMGMMPGMRRGKGTPESAWSREQHRPEAR